MSIRTRSRPETQARQRTFRIHFVSGELTYAVIPLAPDPAVARRAYRFHKLGGDRAIYDVHLNGHGPECECLGFLRWQKPCKHIRMLVSAGMLPSDCVPTPQAVTTGGTSDGQEA